MFLDILTRLNFILTLQIHLNDSITSIILVNCYMFQPILQLQVY